MRNKNYIVFIALFTFLLHNSNAQPGYREWVHTSQVVSDLYGIVPFKNNTWIVTGVNCNWPDFLCGSEIYIFDSALNKTKTIQLAVSDKIVLDKNYNIISIGSYRYGDVIPQNILVLSIYDEYLNEKLNKNFYNTWKALDEFGSEITGLNVLNDSNLLVNNDSSLLKVSYSAVFQSVHRVKNIKKFNYVLPLNDHLYLLTSGNKVYSCDSTGNTTYKYTFSGICAQPQLFQDTFYIAAGSSLYRLDANLSIIDSVDLGFMYVDTISHIRITQNNIWILGVGGQVAVKPFIAKLRRDFSIVSQISMPEMNPYIPYKHFEVNEPYFISGNSGNYRHISLYQFNSQNFNYPVGKPDLELDSLYVDAIQTDSFYAPYDSHWYKKGFSFTAHFKLTNPGSYTINKLHVHIPARYIGTSGSTRPDEYAEFKNLNLEPGNSVNLTMKSYYQGPPPKSFQLCLIGMLPNDVNEFNTSNNSVCEIFQVVGTENLKERSATKFLLYPNPASTLLNIEYELMKAGFVNICIFDITGREVYKLMNPKQSIGLHHVELPINELKTGTYFCKIITDETSVMISKFSVY